MKTVLITGGTVRLGLAIAERLRAAGWRVITSSHRQDAGADIVCDLAEPMGPARLYAAAMRLCGGEVPDALVNNAALFTGEAQVLEAVNHLAPQKLTMLMAGRESGRGSVVNVLDSRVLDAAAATEPKGAYLASKLALLNDTRKAAAMFSDTLRVNAVAPGPVLAPVGVHLAAEPTPLGRPTPQAVAEAVAFLLDAEFTTGAILPIDGGASLGFY